MNNKLGLFFVMICSFVYGSQKINDIDKAITPKIYDKKHFFSIKTDLSKRIIIPCKLNHKKVNLLFDLTFLF